MKYTAQWSQLIVCCCSLYRRLIESCSRMTNSTFSSACPSNRREQIEKVYIRQVLIWSSLIWNIFRSGLVSRLKNWTCTRTSWYLHAPVIISNHSLEVQCNSDGDKYSKEFESRLLSEVWMGANQMPVRIEQISLELLILHVHRTWTSTLCN